MLLLLLLSFALSLRAATEDITGGQKVKLHSQPYMAYLKIYSQKYERYRCGGFLIQENVVMTAAHCNGRKIKVILGTNNIGKIWNWPRKFSVKKTIPHEGYNKDTHSNDIMLLKEDSGGLLVCDNIAQGIVSYGDKNGIPPGIYTRISFFVPWIKKTLRRM